ESDVQWASRWDAYLKMQDPQIHWFSILNSFMIVIFLSAMVAMILMRALHKDLRRYVCGSFFFFFSLRCNKVDPEELEAQIEEHGWKLVHGDVFRTPEYPSLFATLVGSGAQVIAMSFLTIIFAALGFLSPASRGSLMTTLLILYVTLGILAGYYSARVYKMFAETDWQKQTLQTAFLFPGVNFAVFFILNLFIWHEGSTGAVPFGTMFLLLLLWFGISVPLVYLGAYYGYKKDPPKLPCPTNEIARMIPPQPWYMQKYFAILVGGVLPFGAVFIEVFFIMSSVWLHRYYYMFGFLLLVFVILILTSAEITIVMTYFQLCAEDWQWWWRSVLTAGSAALYLFLYSILYFYTKLDIAPFVSSLLYFGYMFLISLAFFIVSGTIGFVSTFTFVHKIYSAIKIL
ncbi:Endosomal P24A protein precursor, partial [Reticulomyxa filosa]